MLSKYFQKKIALHNPHRPNTRGKNEWLLPSQCDGGNFNYLHHNVMGVTIFMKWLPPSHCDEGNHFLEMVTLITL